eukprot:comp21664_c0_seq1/m.30470 comp21664_c0_seq1/g.30470  ORF comp21664_c0_seq1/g.30470 comp21664_c0_seq1/m.30470 type:complete len:1094 (-) comp21664_c0_seq1:232-3513(-)
MSRIRGGANLGLLALVAVLVICFLGSASAQGGVPSQPWCPAGSFRNSTSGGCQPCTDKFPFCEFCTEQKCLACLIDVVYTEKDTGNCVPCTKFGPTCTLCDEFEGCQDCGNNYYYNKTLGVCTGCKPHVGCPSEFTTCLNDTVSLCKGGKCSKGFYNSPKVFQEECTSCSTIIPGCQRCGENSQGFFVCLDCGPGRYWEYNNETCSPCLPAVGCLNGSTYCQGLDNPILSECLAGQCSKFYYNDLTAYSSSCQPLKVLFETKFLPNQFTIDDMIMWEDLFANLVNGQTRAQYPYPCQIVKMTPDPYRGNRLNIGVTCSQPIEDTWKKLLFVDNATVADALGISCLWFPSEVPAKGWQYPYQKRLCFGCDPIENCAQPGGCDGIGERATCNQCNPGYYVQHGFPINADTCQPCAPLEGCPMQNTVCLNATVSLCAVWGCNNGYYSDSVSSTLGTLASGSVQGAKCLNCTPAWGCRDGFTNCTTNQNSVCAKGKCREWEGYYNQLASCDPDYSVCKLPNITLELNMKQSEFTPSYADGWADQFAANVFGLGPTSYPYPFVILGTRTNHTSGLLLVDIDFTQQSMSINNQNGQTYILNAALNGQSNNGTWQLASVGVVCVVRPVDQCACSSTPGLTPAQGSPCQGSGVQIYNRPICLPCVPVPNCVGEITCPLGPFASRCATCDQGYYNNRSEGYYPDTCLKCPQARNCTDGNTVCTCPNDPLCLPGRCAFGYYNNPAPPVLDCGFQDAYQCWSSKEIANYSARTAEAVRTSATVVDRGLLIVNQTSLEFARPFLYCPYYGHCKPTVKHYKHNKFYSDDFYDRKFTKRATLTEIEARQYVNTIYSVFEGFLDPAATLPNIAKLNFPWYPLVTPAYQVNYGKSNFKRQLKQYSDLFDKCLKPEPAYASPCKRQTVCRNPDQWQIRPGTGYTDTQCGNNCSLVKIGQNCGDNQQSLSCTDYYWNSTTDTCTSCHLAPKEICSGLDTRASFIDGYAVPSYSQNGCSSWYWSGAEGKCKKCGKVHNCIDWASVCNEQGAYACRWKLSTTTMATEANQDFCKKGYTSAQPPNPIPSGASPNVYQVYGQCIDSTLANRGTPV